jgi:tetratricopeptide (TPR) repeat protein
MLEPDHRDALLVKGASLIRMKEVAFRAQARATFERLLEIEPTSFEAGFGLMKVYLAIGPLERARELLPRLLAQRPDDPKLAAFKHELDARLATAIEVGRRAEPSAPATRRQVSRARYPDALSAFADAREAARRYLLPPGPPPVRFLTAEARGFTLGSCFAGRIARELQRLGRDVFHMQLAETVNTTFANLAFLQWLATGGGRHAAYFEREATERKTTREEIAARLAAADFVIYTLGVAPAFFERATGEFVPHQAEDFRQFRFLADHEYRTSTVEQNVANLRAIHELLQRVRPGVRLVLTVSPVPLGATFEMASGVVAACVSKSVLRAAAHEFLKGAGAEVSYWPSYEMVRWIGGHTGGAFGGDDGSNHHVTDALVTDIVELFVEYFGESPAA